MTKSYSRGFLPWLRIAVYVICDENHAITHIPMLVDLLIFT